MDAARLNAHKQRNSLQSLLLIAGLAFVCAYPAWLLAGPLGAWLALGLVAFSYFLNPAASPRLLMRLYRGRPVPPSSAPRLYRILHSLAQRAGLPRTPTLYYLPSQVMNAFTSGSPDDAVIALSDGLLRRLDLRELAAVLGHELSHIEHQDIRVMGFADLSARVTSYLSLAGILLLLLNLPLILFTQVYIDWLAIFVLLAAPSVSALLQLALSRNREFEADLRGAELSGDPQALASALEKMQRLQGQVLEGLLLPGQAIPDPSLLRTHPPTPERIRRLLELRERRPIPPLPQGLELRQPWSEIPCQDCDRPRWRRTGIWF